MSATPGSPRADRLRLRFRALGQTLAWVLATLLATLALSIAATAAGPGWDPPPAPAPPPGWEVSGPETTIAPGLVADTTPVGTYDVETTTRHVRLDSGVEIEATLRMPVGAPGPVPGVVMVHGTGTDGPNAYFDMTTALASSGVAALVPAKDTTAYTTAHRDYPQQARDAARNVAALADVEGVDPDRIGIYGESEGAVLAPLAAGIEPRVAFVVLVSSPVVPLRDVAGFAADSYLTHTHVPATVFPVIGRLTGITPPGGALTYADVDTRPALVRLGVPVFTAYGTKDQSMPQVQGPLEIDRQLSRAVAEGHRASLAHTVRWYEGGTHGIRIDSELIDAWPRDLATWIEGLPLTADAAPRLAGATPAQRIAAVPPVSPPRWADGWAIPIGFGIGVAAVALGAVAAAVARLRERQVTAVAGSEADGTVVAQHRRVRVSAWRCVVLVVLALAAYVDWLWQVAGLALNYRTNDVVVRDQFGIVHLLVALAVGSFLAALVRAVSARRDRRRRRRLATGRAVDLPGGRSHRLAVVGLLGGSAILLWLGAYWGALPLWR